MFIQMYALRRHVNALWWLRSLARVVVLSHSLLTQTGGLLQGYPALFLAALQGWFKAAEWLVANRADINKAFKVGAPGGLGGERCCGAR